jgi:hypothetical protein
MGRCFFPESKYSMIRLLSLQTPAGETSEERGGAAEEDRDCGDHYRQRKAEL